MKNYVPILFCLALSACQRENLYDNIVTRQFNNGITEGITISNQAKDYNISIRVKNVINCKSSFRYDNGELTAHEVHIQFTYNNKDTGEVCLSAKGLSAYEFRRYGTGIPDSAKTFDWQRQMLLDYSPPKDSLKFKSYEMGDPYPFAANEAGKFIFVTTCNSSARVLGVIENEGWFGMEISKTRDSTIIKDIINSLTIQCAGYMNESKHNNTLHSWVENADIGVANSSEKPKVVLVSNKVRDYAISVSVKNVIASKNIMERLDYGKKLVLSGANSIMHVVFIYDKGDTGNIYISNAQVSEKGPGLADTTAIFNSQMQYLKGKANLPQNVKAYVLKKQVRPTRKEWPSNYPNYYAFVTTYNTGAMLQGKIAGSEDFKIEIEDVRNPAVVNSIVSSFAVYDDPVFDW